MTRFAVRQAGPVHESVAATGPGERDVTAGSAVNVKFTVSGSVASVDGNGRKRASADGRLDDGPPPDYFYAHTIMLLLLLLPLLLSLCASNGLHF